MEREITPISGDRQFFIPRSPPLSPMATFKTFCRLMSPLNKAGDTIDKSAVSSVYCTSAFRYIWHEKPCHYNAEYIISTIGGGNGAAFKMTQRNKNDICYRANPDKDAIRNCNYRLRNHVYNKLQRSRSIHYTTYIVQWLDFIYSRQIVSKIISVYVNYVNFTLCSFFASRRSIFRIGFILNFHRRFYIS